MEPRRPDPDVLTPTHRTILRVASEAEAEYGDVGLRLDGGTALAAYYLGHRESEDLDLFAGPSFHADDFASELARALEGAGLETHTVSAGAGFAEVVAGGVRVHMARTSPFLLEEPFPTEEGVPVTSFRDLAAGKLHAVCDRFEVRDFIDVHAILARPDEEGRAPSEALQGERAGSLLLDLLEIDPGLTTAIAGQALARGLDRALIGAFPLRLLVPVDEGSVQRSLRIAVDTCARLTRERMRE
jgi:hypothetical protein